MPDLRWYLRRAAAMSPGEVLHRLRFHATKSRWRRAVVSGWDPAGNRQAAPLPTVPRAPLELTDVEQADLLKEAKLYMEHHWLFFGLRDTTEPTIEWHRDPTSGLCAPDMMFGFDIDHRNESVVGNIKMTWEKSRHHHLTVLATAYHLTQDERYAREVTNQVANWIAANPFLRGVHWTHPLEQGIRLIAWAWCERLLRGSAAHADLFAQNERFQTSLYQHQWFIEQTYSRGSSANNHLIGEMAGLYVAACAWPWFEPSDRWRSLAKDILEREIVRQTFPSGLNREQAFSYHIFTLEFFLLCEAEAQQRGEPFSAAFASRLQDMIHALVDVTDCGGNLPRYGDGDEGRAIQWRAITDHRSDWLLDHAHQLGFNTKPTKPHSTFMDDAGLAVMRSQTTTGKKVFVLADAGPHGFLSIAAHAHADALAFTLSVDGHPFLVDPGTYAYHTDKHWRDYFRSTAAHNTLLIDGLEQSEVGGAFLWLRRAVTTVYGFEATENGAILNACHDGFARRGITHRRQLALDGSLLSIEDALEGRGSHDVELRFHTSPTCTVLESNEETVRMERDGIILDLTPPENSRIRLARGEPDAGWYSPVFGAKEETTTVVLTQTVSAPVTLTTRLEIKA